MITTIDNNIDANNITVIVIHTIDVDIDIECNHMTDIDNDVKSIDMWNHIKLWVDCKISF